MTREEFIRNVTSEQKQLRLFLLGLCSNDSSLADDIAQETLMKAYIASAEYKPRYKFSTWLLKIAYNTYLDHQKLYHIKNRSPLDSSQEKEYDKASDSRYEYENLYLAVDQLSDKEKTVIMLFYIYGFSIKEISAVTGDSLLAVKKQLSRAREHLKTKLSENGNGR